MDSGNYRLRQFTTREKLLTRCRSKEKDKRVKGVRRTKGEEGQM